ncbi:bifunctional 4-hydroxy-2-oxoglutarate aldolase/2-dehydro-3-deoxy-phosphogluconate aldolase [Legionella jordanis]|uniref:2-dehydro-3-deoxy-phosphogluconate aldolase n=1 Tax=Legionella jordanis TaxID=456 RepID=A0A0W0VAE8_9GAMM|nr:bifunctional 4-hydroxy-2-oxoglutarate aldolase/2-dehydro-3-deoxy-phosphogluconate aldolase [Legionella jordanis]KTD17074.1 bifunctional 2-keto-3-deoxygluconate 6- phosphate aldolase/4-hydroxy-2-oxoglutarate aldolase [Legionella jordanis]RMX03207.1 keto-hydroxyglutarate-aldolase/keto-deoxy-phosphogluconate aldolase [Legionella jordanis]RMX18653.1 keto-hydroxyglutarate-aldolase/keto-deoxy-phosphogluconate aldolase [Legionella jordanis]VEH12729.1 multifunctional- 2-keto-3-deoxygluconate 6-phosp
MSIDHWNIKPKDLFSLSPIIPVIVLEDLADALPLARALVEGGMKVLEITLRTPVAYKAIGLLRQELPDVLIGAGTVLNPSQLNNCIGAGAQFAISPGLTQDLLKAGLNAEIAYVPAAASLSEMMEGFGLGYDHFKFFPAEYVGGLGMLKAIQGPLPQLQFCATGGINENNYLDYLSLANVACVGGTWMLPKTLVQQKSWQRITELALAANREALSIE